MFLLKMHQTIKHLNNRMREDERHSLVWYSRVGHLQSRVKSKTLVLEGLSVFFFFFLGFGFLLKTRPTEQNGSKLEPKAQHDKAEPLQMVRLQIWHGNNNNNSCESHDTVHPSSHHTRCSSLSAEARGADLSVMHICRCSGGSH